ncbi:unnamed protein product, partial [Symbiodinium pilosum]
ENGGDESWYSFSHTFAMARAVSYEEIAKFVAMTALDYPYFTWDEAGSYQRCAEGLNIKECHCRIFADRLLEQFLAPDEVERLPKDMDCSQRLPRSAARVVSAREPGGCLPCCWLSSLLSQGWSRSP